ncbi:MAG: hypothetical protein KJZ86_19580 [Caldilineaceae bacterium]|nr:hypothetical protein [Caldilineaceae bacterium]HRJ42211.1 hypothetical protein [Caldilineaceae bacterium]
MRVSNESWRRFFPLISMGVVGLFSFFLYLPALQYGFFNDDPSGNFQWMEGIQWYRLFVSSEGYGFYRPTGFVIWKLLYALAGEYNTTLFHAFSLIMHAVNTALLWLLAFWLGQRHGYAWLVALAFATFPLQYEAVAYVAALFHLLLVFFVLVVLLCYYHARRTGSYAYLLVVHLALVLALFTHENWFIIPLLIVSMEWLLCTDFISRRSASRSVWQFLVAPTLFMGWWLLVPKLDTPGPQSVTEVLKNTLPFLQSLVYPLLPFARLSVSQVVGLLVLAGCVVLITHIIAHRIRTRALWTFALGWLVFAALPNAVALAWDYLHGSPRLYYLSSIGIAMLWAMPVLALGQLSYKGTRQKIITAVVQIGLALMIVLPPLPFVRCEMGFYAQTTRLIQLLVAAAQNTPTDQNLVFVNLPFYFTSHPESPDGCPATYPFVTTGAVVVPAYADLSDFIRVNGGPDRPVRGAVVVEYDSIWPPRYGTALPLTEIRGLLQETRLYVFDNRSWTLWNLTDVWTPYPPLPSMPLAVFEDSLELASAKVNRSGDNLSVDLEWRIMRLLTRPMTAFVHLYAPTGQLMAQHDGVLGQNGHPEYLAPAVLWQDGDLLRETHLLQLPDPLPAGEYAVAVGVYYSDDIQRLMARTSVGEPLKDNVSVVQYWEIR